MIYFIVALCSIVITYLVLKPKLQQTQQLNDSIIQQNKELDDKNQTLKKEYDTISLNKSHIQSEIDILRNQRNDFQENIEALKRQAQQSADAFYEQAMKIAEQRFDADLALEERAFGDAQGKAEEEYLKTLEDLQKSFQEKMEIGKKEYEQLTAEVADLKAKRDAAVEQAKRQLEVEDNLKYYQVVLSQEDVDEVKALLSIEYLLRNKRNLRMLLWTSYYSKAVNDLAGRVLGNKEIMGIYKITNIQTQQVYIGQAQNVRIRWRDHVKAGGLDIDRPSTNDFYKNMQQYGVENFTFELQEECSADRLNEREKYWIDFFQSKTFGLNGNAGNSK